MREVMVIEIALGVWLGLVGWALTARLARALLVYWREVRTWRRMEASWRSAHRWAALKWHQEWVR